LGERFTNALTSQFPKDKFSMKKFNFVQNTGEAKKAFSKMTPNSSILFHTVMERSLKKAVQAFAKKKKIPSFDLTGPPTEFVIRNLDVKPVWDVRVIHAINEAYDRRIDAIEYTMSHDDGVGHGTLGRADVILVGPSRTSKTPTSVYLAMKGYRVANIPIVQSPALFDDLMKLKGDPSVIGFVIDPVKLREVRLKRVSELGTVPHGYTDLEEIAKEINFAKRIYNQLQWKTIDITSRAIEETAALVMRHIQID
jgi:regulator of PEP synthase PpsR (kinase-PPPase family)